ncbi:MAG: hypothetical protein BWX71_02382 [Deltaproteobacteria bacterium ADurb.Bin072]|nr:MAG: hypothetical protein BWX71_02382 [Deltaproteobacteria bacterium ADurb.Bin072]
MTPLGGPVVPEVYIRVARSWALMLLMRSSNSLASAFDAPSFRASVNRTTPSTDLSSSSKMMISLRFGSLGLTSTILAMCSPVATKHIFESEFSMT